MKQTYLKYSKDVGYNVICEKINAKTNSPDRIFTIWERDKGEKTSFNEITV